MIVAIDRLYVAIFRSTRCFAVCTRMGALLDQISRSVTFLLIQDKQAFPTALTSDWRNVLQISVWLGVAVFLEPILTRLSFHQAKCLKELIWQRCWNLLIYVFELCWLWAGAARYLRLSWCLFTNSKILWILHGVAKLAWLPLSQSALTW